MTLVARAKPSPTDPTLDGRSVLIIEDHPDSRELLMAVFQSLRAHVFTAASIEDAERQLALYRPHVIVCDMKLPDGTGLDFIGWLRSQPRRGRPIPCVAITGYEQHFPATAATGFDAYMRKPLDLDRFCAVVVALARS
jgi:CheY-like chemotaxis protein